jgi:hypothetical protein
VTGVSLARGPPRSGRSKRKHSALCAVVGQFTLPRSCQRRRSSLDDQAQRWRRHGTCQHHGDESTGGWVSWTSGPGGKSHLPPGRPGGNREPRGSAEEAPRAFAYRGVRPGLPERRGGASVASARCGPQRRERPVGDRRCCGSDPRPAQHLAVSFARMGGGPGSSIQAGMYLAIWQRCRRSRNPQLGPLM